jgi:hypothetical protein
MSAKSRKFFQFPIKLLAAQQPVSIVSHDAKKERLQEIVSYSLGDTMERLATNYSIDELEAWAEAEQERQNVQFDRRRRNDIVTLATVRTLHVQAGGRHFDRWRRIKRDVDARDYGRTMVRVSTDLFWDAHASWTWRDFAVLAAVNAAIGNNRFALVRLNRLHALTVGCSNLAERDARKLARFQLTDNQLRYTLERLRRRKLFVKASPDRRSWYYSILLTQEALENALVAREVNRRKAERPSDRTPLLRDRITAAIEAAALNRERIRQ